MDQVWFEDLISQDEIGKSGGVTEDDWAQGPPPDVLPVDERREEIVRHVRERRVTVIEGETGCGKSSRVPIFLHEATPNCRMFITQPKRIAVQSLLNRMRQAPGFADVVGMRMGHGLRDEGPKTRMWLVTTGYLVRLLAHHPEAFDSHTHLIIDEVHERSVDTDLLCLLTRRLLERHPRIKLVLMSATMAAKLYTDYFSIPEEPLFVGARRFPVDIVYAAGLRSLGLPVWLDGQAATLAALTDANNAPNPKVSALQHKLAVELAVTYGCPGSSVLIFVSGMNSIVEIMDLFERRPQSDVTYRLLPIHSDLPFEEQLSAFEPMPEEVKIIVATNAAESSVTLPDVDTVICCGTAKQITYNAQTHRTQLSEVWISRASAKQRAGRTGRVRPGRVFRLYDKELFDRHMSPYEVGELHRQPLDSVIMSLRAMLGQKVVPVLQEVIDPPDISRVQRSFQSLHELGFLTLPSDDGGLTPMGRFVAAVGVDLLIARLIGIGTQFDLLPEALILAAVLSMPRSPFRQTTPLIHTDPEEYNNIVGATMVAQAEFDGGIYSEPIMVLRLFYRYEHTKDRHAFCLRWALSHSRMRQLDSTVKHLRTRVASQLHVEEESIGLRGDPRDMSPAKVNRLRCILVWAFKDSLLECGHSSLTAPRKGCWSDGVYGFQEEYYRESSEESSEEGSSGYSDEISEEGSAGDEEGSESGGEPETEESEEGQGKDGHGNRDGNRGHEFCETMPFMRLAVVGQPPHPDSVRSLVPEGLPWNFETGRRQQLQASLRWQGEMKDLFAQMRLWVAKPRLQQREKTPEGAAAVTIGCASAAWLVCRAAPRESERLRLWLRPDVVSLALGDGILEELFSPVRAGVFAEIAGGGRAAVMEFQVPCSKKNLRLVKQLLGNVPSAVQVVVEPDAVRAIVAEGSAVGEAELRRLFGTTTEFSSQDRSLQDRLTLIFAEAVPTAEAVAEKNSWMAEERILREAREAEGFRPICALARNTAFLPLLLDMPLGARIVAAIASGYKDRRFRLWTDPCARQKGKSDFQVSLPVPIWRCGLSGHRSGIVFTPRNSLASSAVHSYNNEFRKERVFAVAGTMLDLQGGGARAEGITFLPPGESWLAMALLAFGLAADGLPNHRLCEEDEEDAESFHLACCEIGEEVKPHPELVENLDRLFGF